MKRREPLGAVRRAASHDNPLVASELAREAGLADAGWADDERCPRRAQARELVLPAHERSFGSALECGRRSLGRAAFASTLACALDHRAADRAAPDQRFAGLDADACTQRVVNRGGSGVRTLGLIFLNERQHERFRLLCAELRRDARDGVDDATSLTLVLFRVELERDLGCDGHDRDLAPFGRSYQSQGRAGVKAGILLQDRPLKFAENRTRLEPVVGERVACFAERVECVLLPACAVQREHQLAVAPLSRRLDLDECLELADQLAGATQHELRFDSLLFRLVAQLLEAGDLLLGEGVEREIGERVSTPERERVGGARRSARRLACARLGEQLLEAHAVERLRVDVEHIPGWSRGERQVIAQQRSESVRVCLQGVLCLLRRRFRPEGVDQAVDRDDTAVIHEQHREERPWLRGAQGHRRAVAPDLQGPEHPKLHRHVSKSLARSRRVREPAAPTTIERPTRTRNRARRSWTSTSPSSGAAPGAIPPRFAPHSSARRSRASRRSPSSAAPACASGAFRPRRGCRQRTSCTRATTRSRSSA